VHQQLQEGTENRGMVMVNLAPCQSRYVAEDHLIDIEHTAPGDTGGKATLERGCAGRKISPLAHTQQPDAAGINLGPGSAGSPRGLRIRHRVIVSSFGTETSGIPEDWAATARHQTKT
jgi:hypothetical protein